MEKYIRMAIYAHAALGGLALLSGAMAIYVKKGSCWHKRSGRLFFFSMLFSAVSALVISCLPHHESPFLFSIGLFSIYFLITGLRSLGYKRAGIKLGMDRVIAWLIIIVGIAMIMYPVLWFRRLDMVLTTFGIVGFVFGIRDLRMLGEIGRPRKNWLKLHLGKMTGGYIAAVTAFFVVNQILPGVWNWFFPGMVGGGYITFWMRKLNKNKIKPTRHKP